MVSLSRLTARVRGDALRVLGNHRLAGLLAALEPRPTPQIAAVAGPALMRSRLGEAAGALSAVGQSHAEIFRALRLELNRLEQGGLVALERAAVSPPPAPVEPATVTPLALLRDRSRALAARVVRRLAA